MHKFRVVFSFERIILFACKSKIALRHKTPENFNLTSYFKLVSAKSRNYSEKFQLQLPKFDKSRRVHTYCKLRKFFLKKNRMHLIFTHGDRIMESREVFPIIRCTLENFQFEKGKAGKSDGKPQQAHFYRIFFALQIRIY